MSLLRNLAFLFIGATALFQSSQAQPPDESYTLRPNDIIRLNVYEEPDLSVQVRILKTGQASLPLIGTVDVGGTTIAAATAKVRDLYAADYLVDPKITITVDEYSTDFISVIGSVKTPGQIPLPNSSTLDLGAAIATAGGLTPNADTNNIQLVRESGATSTFSFSAIQSGQAGRIKLAPGDRVIVTDSQFIDKSVTILGKVNKTGAVMFPVNGKLDLVTAVGLAGGLHELANPKKVSINRKGKVIVVDFREMSQRGGTPFPLQPDDVITVPERLF